MEDIILYSSKLIGIKYTLWEGDHQSTYDNSHPFYIDYIPDLDYIKKYGINCAGLVNILRLKTCGNVPGEGKWRGGTLSWYNHLKSINALVNFNINEDYPVGTLLLRNYRDIYEQGHLAVIYKKHKNVPGSNYSIIHAFNGKTQSKVVVSLIKDSHFIISEGFYEYAILPNNWLYK